MCSDWTETGWLRVRTYAANSVVPVKGVFVRVLSADGVNMLFEGNTDEAGIFENIALPCPPRACSQTPDADAPPYGIYTLTATREGYMPVRLEHFEVFSGETSEANLGLEPEDALAINADVRPQPDTTVVPQHVLYAGGGGSGTPPLETCSVTPELLLQTVIIPEKITVHLGKPSSSARNVTVPFTDYIKNVASSEVYPTWPEQALRANIHAQISLALNRIYTEWYRSKGYSFDITNSTSYDQYYVQGREIFKVMSTIVDDIFSTYVRKVGTVNPFYAEYCDGKSVSCPGMKQWGTVTQANQGKNALQILKYYYGNDIEIIRTNNIGSVPESYPGAPLRLGSTGIYVKVIQRQLNRIAKNYPFFGTTEVDGVFGATTQSIVKKFQKQFSLTSDGVVGRSTWYKISYIYVAVKKLAELGGEGEAPTGDLVAGTYPGTALRIGNTGNNVYQMQFWLSEVASVTPEIPSLSVDGIFGTGTENSVRAFQQKFGLAMDGVVGASTWNAIYAQYVSLETDSNPGVNTPGQFPGTTLSPGSRGDNVRVMQFYLAMVARYNSSIPTVAVDGIFGPATERSVMAFQSFYGLLADGLVGKLTWNKMYEVYTDLVNSLLTPNARPGTYPGTPLQVGSTGQAVKEMQYYLYLLSAYYNSIPVIAYDGVFGSSTKAAVMAYQTLANLTPDGIVGPATWNSLYERFSVLRNSDGTVAAARSVAYPGTPLKLGSQGTPVRYVQFMLQYIGQYFASVLPVATISGTYEEDTMRSVQSFQTLYALPPTGEVDTATWNAMVLAYGSSGASGNEAMSATTPEGEYPGYVLKLGSAGTKVWDLQTYMNGIASRYCIADFVPSSGVFDTATENGVKAFQDGFGLPITGIVDLLTWDAIYAYYLYEIYEPG